MRERGNLLGMLPDAGLVVADVSVVRPAAQTYARNTVRTGGSSTRPGEQLKYRLASPTGGTGLHAAVTGNVWQGSTGACLP
jgi:hypothetical protein